MGGGLRGTGVGTGRGAAPQDGRPRDAIVRRGVRAWRTPTSRRRSATDLKRWRSSRGEVPLLRRPPERPDRPPPSPHGRARPGAAAYAAEAAVAAPDRADAVVKRPAGSLITCPRRSEPPCGCSRPSEKTHPVRSGRGSSPRGSWAGSFVTSRPASREADRLKRQGRRSVGGGRSPCTRRRETLGPEHRAPPGAGAKGHRARSDRHAVSGLVVLDAGWQAMSSRAAGGPTLAQTRKELACCWKERTR